VSPTARHPWSPRAVAGWVAAALVALSLPACQQQEGAGTEAAAPGTTPGSFPRSGPPGDPPQTVDQADIERAVEQLPRLIEEARARTGVPGISVAVVFEDKVVFARGFGLRELGTDKRVDAGTAFQLASVSKPVGATVMASLVGDGTISWDGLIREADPGFALADPAVTERLTFADLYAHRSGLPDHAGDLLEDLGYRRDEVLQRLRYYRLSPFRAHYAYTNFGLTEAAVAAAGKTGRPWEDLSAERLYRPLGMTATSSRFADFMAAPNRARPHVREPDGDWVVSAEQRAPDAQTPAGGVSSTVNDMARWLRLQVGDGRFEGREIVKPDALQAARTPHMTSMPPRSPTARAGFYGLGFNVSYDEAGRTKVSHSGGFTLGAATCVGVLTNERLGVAVLTNGMPIGVPEAVVEMVNDLVTEGQITRDWLALYGQALGSLYPTPEVDYTTPPAGATPARPAARYTGTYTSPIYGPLRITAGAGGELTLHVGPKPVEAVLRHYDADTFWFAPPGENAELPSPVVFTVSGSGPASAVRVGWLDGDAEPSEGIGTFTRT
jgi:CubicO group peptidase (beta-lactamase class C family)